MNELEIIRRQLAVEQSHAVEVANACATVFAAQEVRATPSEATTLFREACVSYLVWVLSRFEECDQTLAERLGSRRSSPRGAADVSAELARLINQSGTSREALSRLEAALAARESDRARAAWQEFAYFFNSAWTPRRLALERALAEHLSVADWRAISAIDADSMLDERTRYARVAAHLPAGIELQRKIPGNA